ncbi:MAG: SsrA-binding protein SmpB [Saccharofermentanales bacterium]
MALEKGIKIIAENRKAFHEYFIEEKMEAGIELSGTEVKSVRQGKMNLSDSYVMVKDGELWLVGTHISPFEQGNRFNKDPMRTRKLLMHKREIVRLFGVVKQEGLTLVPTKSYFKNGRIKIEVGLAKGKKTYDKRDALAEKQANRDIDRKMKERRYE